MKRLLLPLVVFFVFLGFAHGQNITTKQGLPDNVYVDDGLIEKLFGEYEIFQMDLSQVEELQKGKLGQIEAIDIEINVGGFSTTAQLYNSGLVADNYRRTYSSGKLTGSPVASPMMGYTSHGDVTRFTINTGYLHGYIDHGGTRYYIDHLDRFDASANSDLFIIYDIAQATFEEEGMCGMPELDMEDVEVLESVEQSSCYLVRYALATDYSMYQKHGSGLEDHLIAITNDVQTNYESDFSEGLQYVIVETYMVDCSGCDPWTSSTDPMDLLNDFTPWATGSSGFTETFILASCWTDRNFNQNVVGLAWVGTVCTSHRTNVLQDFTANPEYLRVLTAHELGHNWGSLHDAQGSPYIMAPTVSEATEWSSQSKGVINTAIASAISSGCLIECPATDAPIADFSGTPTEGCTPLTVSFTDMSQNSPNAWLWTFPGGNPSSSTLKNPVVTYNTGGNYNVTLKATNAAGSDTKTINSYIQVGETPTASFTQLVDGNQVFFTNTSTGSIDTYYWNFDDGNTSSQENPVHTYAEPGLYAVSLTVTNDCGQNTYQGVVNILAPPIADFTSNKTEICVGDNVNFTNLSPTADSYSWTFSGGTPSSSSLPNPSVTYNQAGTYDVTLMVSNAAGQDQITKSGYITVKELPTAAFDYEETGLSVTFTNTSTNANSYLWTFGDGNNSTEVNPVHQYNAPGTYLVKLTATNDCGDDISTVNIQLTVLPIADFSADNIEICVGDVVQFNSQSTYAESYSWSFTGGTPASSNQENPVISYNQPGIYDVSLTVQNNSGSDTETKSGYITVKPMPVAAYDYDHNGLIVYFENLSTDADTYFWDFGDGDFSTDKDPAHQYGAGGQYSVELTAFNSCGSITTQAIIILVDVPISDFVADITDGCVPMGVDFTSLAVDVDSYFWTFEGGSPATSTQANPTVFYNSVGTFDVSLTVTNASGQDTHTKTNYITVNDAPSAAFTETVQGLQVQFNNLSTNADTYYWDFGDGTTSSQENPSHTYNASGEYVVELTVQNNCGSDNTAQIINVLAAPVAGIQADVVTGCAPLVVQFTSTSTDAETYEWTFGGGNPQSSTEENPIVTFQEKGAYDVTLKVSNAEGEDILVKTDFIVVEDLPVSSFNAMSQGMTVIFTNTSQNATSYHWDFGDGEESTAQHPTHTYNTSANYTVTLTATNICGTVTTSENIGVGDFPSAQFSGSTTIGCAPLQVTFESLYDGDVSSYSWTFNGGTPATSSELSPTVSYTDAGKYDVRLIVENGLGRDTVHKIEYIKVNDVPQTSFTKSPSGLTVTFSNTSENADAYHWDFGDGEESTEKNPQHTYSQGGSYTVTLTAINACGESEYTENIDLQSKPQADFAASIREGCAPLTVKFTSTSSDADSYAWTFEGGNPSSSTEANPTVIYESAGSYRVSLTVQNSTGQDTKTRQNYIVVHDTPIADFTAETEGLTVAFANSSVSATSYHWDFGDGEESTETNPIHTYAESGEYSVILRAINDCGESSKSRKVGVGDYPNAEFEAENRDGCVPLEVRFNNLYDGDISSYLWSFPGGSPSSSTESSPVVVYNAVGTYDVQLIVENGLGLDTIIKKDYIRVGDVAQSAFSWERSGLTVSFTEEVEGSYTGLRWEFGDGSTSTETNPSHTYGSYGRYDVLLIAENACGKDTSHQELYFMHPATASFNVGALSGCAPLTVQMENTSTGDALEYKWHFPGGSPSTSSAMSPEVHYATPGVYSVELIAYNSESSDTLYREELIEVYALPEVEFNFVVSGDTVYFTNLSKHGDGYLWSFGDGEESEEVDPVHYYEDGLNGKEVSLTVYNQCDTVTKRVKLDTTLPPVGKMDAEIRKICVGTSLQFYDVSEGIVEVREWIFEGGTPERTSSQNPIVQYNETGRYDVTLIVSNGVGTDTLYEKDFIRVIDVPIAEFDYEIMGDSVRFLQRSEYGDEYRWDFGNGHRENSASPSIRYSASGEYMVELIVRNQCGADTIRKEISIITAVSSIPKSSVKVYPNPFTDQLTIEFSREISGPTELVVRDLSGREIYASSYVIKGGDRVRLYLDDISAGLYILQLRNEGRLVHYKLIKQ